MPWPDNPGVVTHSSDGMARMSMVLRSKSTRTKRMASVPRGGWLSPSAMRLIDPDPQTLPGEVMDAASGGTVGVAGVPGTGMDSVGATGMAGAGIVSVGVKSPVETERAGSAGTNIKITVTPTRMST